MASSARLVRLYRSSPAAYACVLSVHSMARALAYGGAAAAAAFGPPWLAVLGVAMVSVWAITLTVLLCGNSSNSPRRPRYSGAGAGAAAAASGAGTVYGASGAGGVCGGGGGGGGGCGGGGGGGGC